MIYYIPHEQPNGTYQLETITLCIWRNPVKWLREFRKSLQLPQTTASYADELALYKAKKEAAGVSE